MASNKEDMISKAKKALSLGSDLVELRLDYLKDSEEDFDINAFSDKCIITNRLKLSKETLVRWVKRRPKYIDLELDFLEKEKELELGDIIPIISWHDFNGTPDTFQLLNILKRASKYKGFIKIVTLAKNLKDNFTLLKLYRYSEKGKLIAFCMGEEGRISRLLSILLSSPLTYVCLPGEEVAPGQIDLLTMLEIKDALQL